MNLASDEYHKRLWRVVGWECVSCCFIWLNCKVKLLAVGKFK